jgi:hypothetical protein
VFYISFNQERFHVLDFHSSKKDFVDTLNVCATQELRKRIVAQDERMKDLEER